MKHPGINAQRKNIIMKHNNLEGVILIMVRSPISLFKLQSGGDVSMEFTEI